MCHSREEVRAPQHTPRNKGRDILVEVFEEFANTFFAPTIEAHEKYNNVYDNLTWKDLVPSLAGFSRHLFFIVRSCGLTKDDPRSDLNTR